METNTKQVGGRKRLTDAEIERAANIGFRIIGAAAKAALYVATLTMAYKATVRSAEVLATRIVFPGGEIFTIPLIIGLLWAGWEMRGDVERAWRQYCQAERRRRQRERL